MSAKHWERRRFFRIPISGKALLQHGRRVDGLYSLENLSIGGCMLSHGPDCSLGERVALTLHVEGEDEIELPAKIVRHESDGAGSLLGLAFTDTDALFEDRIQDLVMRSLERDRQSAVLVVHAEPERVSSLLDSIQKVGQRVIRARTPRIALDVLEREAEPIHMAIIAPVVGTSRARDIVKFILRRFPHVQCVLLSRGGAERLTRAIRSAAPEELSATWSLSRLRKVISKHELVMVASA